MSRTQQAAQWLTRWLIVLAFFGVLGVIGRIETIGL